MVNIEKKAVRCYLIDPIKLADYDKRYGIQPETILQGSPTEEKVNNEGQKE